MKTRIYRIVETDNHGGDYPDETFLRLPLMTHTEAIEIAAAINKVHCNNDQAPRFWKVVTDDYELAPGFEP